MHLIINNLLNLSPIMYRIYLIINSKELLYLFIFLNSFVAQNVSIIFKINNSIVNVFTK